MARRGVDQQDRAVRSVDLAVAAACALTAAVWLAMYVRERLAA
jgi:hypothetical protein